MKLTRKQRQKKVVESPVKKARRERQKQNKLEVRQAEEKKMAEYLLENGWQNTGVLKDVWKTSGWDRVEDCSTTLCRAYRIQKKLEANGFVKAAGIDDDLNAAILGE